MMLHMSVDSCTFSYHRRIECESALFISMLCLDCFSEDPNEKQFLYLFFRENKRLKSFGVSYII
ncbi:hypothetical protein BpHYR1_029803 [Brachionus plicatilis]|uniref:Uncharacterized protein n=1 Tax=Brachionus plicatilis TaxID=10195 RepID=A0A3M7SS75_BRAPC|nr:hypothetical protein BpHYR1_029803 [Brachionus plicatilis]